MADIRPTSWQTAPAPITAPGRTAAQRAFFDAAMGRAAPAAPVPAAQPIAAPAQRPLQASPLSEEPPRKILRPGSLVDIRV
ncbi:MAG: hypothetical protein EON95_03380 [Caulobacteraceae bacterium]|nr:MAG: hypothetical protein EON95_03380 [Caulobacteraceae bacterium]